MLTGTGTWRGPSRRCGVHDVATRLGFPGGGNAITIMTVTSVLRSRLGQ
ncbi:hypothetical protein HMPREF1549_01518 [Actinomyces johnsonii F0510]|uniref:Uncharacterized protein n=1 Tax=Actinomyces johnsonii F0510 TaxID=1227262 RepID=U1QA87_9ACTO|nr:hypothetical protein HMPREF1549_01518 [Actinomyces johnsonii F0510]